MFLNLYYPCHRNSSTPSIGFVFVSFVVVYVHIMCPLITEDICFNISHLIFASYI